MSTLFFVFLKNQIFGEFGFNVLKHTKAYKGGGGGGSKITKFGHKYFLNDPLFKIHKESGS